MDILFIIGQILFGGYFIMSGSNHFLKFRGMSDYAKSQGVPFPELAVFFSGSLIFLGGLGILLGSYVKLSVLFLAMFLLPVTLQMHNFWAISDPAQKMAQKDNFFRNMAFLGAALMLLAIPASSWVINLF
ncbi:MAG: DoxX family protein [Candidatus Moranbacteria bacterium GW2011_GWE1_49_15]|nr:MAG: DoxX family protein [Candidatus Moranbacteria bacterium GW2011_GWE1_49_15]HBP01154.1 DoxX family protein [Candidatus Moranbacteria bacterium]